MRSISSDFKNEQDSGNRNYLKYADVTLIDGTVFNFTNKELWQNGLSFESDTSNSGSFDIGSAMISKLTLQINNFDGTYSKYDFNNAKVVAYVGLQLTDRIENIKICTATVTDAPITVPPSLMLPIVVTSPGVLIAPKLKIFVVAI